MVVERDTKRTLLAGLAFGTLMALAVLALVLSMARAVPAAPGWGFALVAGTLVALVALLLLEPVAEPTTPDLVASSCVACGKPTIEEWRLCPHCGRLLECDLSISTRGERTDG